MCSKEAWNFTNINIPNNIFKAICLSIKINRQIVSICINNVNIDNDGFSLFLDCVTNQESLKKIYACQITLKTETMIKLILLKLQTNCFNLVTKFYFSGNDCTLQTSISELIKNNFFIVRLLENREKINKLPQPKVSLIKKILRRPLPLLYSIYMKRII